MLDFIGPTPGLDLSSTVTAVGLGLAAAAYESHRMARHARKMRRLRRLRRSRRARGAPMGVLLPARVHPTMFERLRAIRERIKTAVPH